MLSKYGRSPVLFDFHGRGEFEGDLLVRPVRADVHVAEVRVPFRVTMAGDPA
jgi:hypothetical protein